MPYSGGFLEGIAETGNILEAGIRGTVSASFAVEDWGAFGLLEVDKAEIKKRKDWLYKKLGSSRLLAFVNLSTNTRFWSLVCLTAQALSPGAKDEYLTRPGAAAPPVPPQSDRCA